MLYYLFRFLDQYNILVFYDFTIYNFTILDLRTDVVYSEKASRTTSWSSKWCLTPFTS